jgi:aspartate aminotransferase-like enzyme
VHNSLYLDTARLGQMSGQACDASIDFSRFANEHGCTLYFLQLLKEGYSSWPSSLQVSYPGLSHWNGVESFKGKLRQIADAHWDSEVLLTSRPASLMKFASKLLTGPCRNVLITDTCWPTYQKILRRECDKAGTQVSTVPIRQKILRQSVSAGELIELIGDHFVQQQCDGLFIPLVDNWGVHLPVEDLVTQIRKRAELRFVVVDGAQSIGHVPLRLNTDYCDFLIAGSHKWLRAFHTMGIGYFGNRGSRDYINDSLQTMRKNGAVDDPLLEFSNELTSKANSRYGETVPVAPMLVTNAAASQKLDKGQLFDQDQSCRTQMTEIACESGWNPVSPSPEMVSKILMIEHPNYQRMPFQADDVCRTLLAGGVSATAYPNGLLRLSLPPNQLDGSDRALLKDALNSVGGTFQQFF